MAGFDVIVIGAGSAGCAVAGRVAQAGARVLLLEAGGGDRHPLIRMPAGWPMASVQPRFGWGYASEPEAQTGGRVLDLPRGRLMGGTSSINGMMYSRGHAEDYDAWAAMGLTGWGYADVLPYFRRSERNWRGNNVWHGGEGPVHVSPNRRDGRLYGPMLAAARELGFAENEDFNALEQAGFGMPDFTVDRTRRESSATAYLGLARDGAEIEVRQGVTVLRLVVEKGRARGVETVRNGHLEVVHADEIVLSAGTFNSPKLLMLSGIGDAAALKAHDIATVTDLPAVGRNLQDHPMVQMAFAVARPLGFEARLRLDRLAGAALSWMARRDGLLNEAPLSIQGYLRRDGGDGRPDTQFQVSHGSPMSRPWFPGWRRPAADVLGVGVLQLDPSGSGSVTLRSADPLAPPSIRLNLLSTKEDMRAARDMMAFTRRFFATDALRDLVAGEILPGSGVAGVDAEEAFLRQSIVTGAHPACTCAMGTDPAASVVDPSLKVHGIEGLRVADASIMPRIVRGNTSAPAMMIGEKAADIIMGWQKAPLRPASPFPGVARQSGALSA